MEISIHEFKNGLSRYLAAAEKGEKIVITKRGAPIVELHSAGRTGGFDFSADDPLRVEFGLDGPSVPVNEDALHDDAFSRAALGLGDDWDP